MKAKPLPPTEYLNECFTYDPISGKLFWKERPRHHFRTHFGWIKTNSQCAGTEAGYRHYQQTGQPGSVTVSFSVYSPTSDTCSVRYLTVHLIIFALMGVAIPEGFEADHKNTDPFDNSWGNLRLATLSQNMANRNSKMTKQYGMPKGVRRRSDSKFSAQITHNGNPIYIGNYPTKELAHAAYCAKATELFGEYARFN